MDLRFFTLVMALFCLLLVWIFALSGVLYDWRTYWFYSLWGFVFGNAYFFAVGALALLDSDMPDPKRAVRQAFWITLFPCIGFWVVLCMMAFS